jgi:hypothetical protein
MSPHCKGCVYHHNAHHPKPTKKNDWCCKTGNSAANSIGRCKLLNLKKEKKDAIL